MDSRVTPFISRKVFFFFFFSFSLRGMTMSFPNTQGIYLLLLMFCPVIPLMTFPLLTFY